MNNLPIPVSLAEFKENVNIRFNNIIDGFETFKNFTIDGTLTKNSETCLIKFISHVFETNESECYIDFYINRLNESEKKNLMSLIDEKDRTLLEYIIDMNHNDIYYKLTDKNLIPFFTKLNTKELFFVTFYFTKKPMTIWGNYNLKFPCFFNDSEAFNYFYNSAKKLKLVQE